MLCLVVPEPWKTVCMRFHALDGMVAMRSDINEQREVFYEHSE